MCDKNIMYGAAALKIMQKTASVLADWAAAGSF
jgi:hypothetical protein